MTKKSVAGAAATAPATELESGCQSSFPIPILPDLPADVKAIVELQDNRRIPTADIVEVVAAIYPKFDRFLLSKVRHGDETGVRLRADAQHELLTHFKVTQDASKAKRTPNRSKPKRISCRLTEAMYEALQRRLAQTGQTAQKYIEAMIVTDLKEHLKEYAHERIF